MEEGMKEDGEWVRKMDFVLKLMSTDRDMRGVFMEIIIPTDME